MKVRNRILAVILALLALLIPVAASAEIDWSKWHYNGTYGRWVDDTCNTSAMKFEVMIYENKNYEGYKTKICHPWSSMCDVPLAGGSAFMFPSGCSSVYALTAMDRISSMKAYEGGNCIALFWSLMGYAGSSWLSGDWPNLHTFGWGDRIESVSAAC